MEHTATRTEKKPSLQNLSNGGHLFTLATDLDTM